MTSCCEGLVDRNVDRREFGIRHAHEREKLERAVNDGDVEVYRTAWIVSVAVSC